MSSIVLEGQVRVGLAEARALIVNALPVEGGLDLYMRLLPDGTPDWEGPVERRLNPHAKRGAAFFDQDLADVLSDLGIEPCLIHRPARKDYALGKSLNDYSISRDEFVKLAERYGVGIFIRPQQEQEVAAADEAASEIPFKKSALIARVHADWRTVETDIREASRNGLKAAAHLGKGWSMSKALAWAESKGKLSNSKRRKTQGATPWSGLS